VSNCNYYQNTEPTTLCENVTVVEHEDWSYNNPLSSAFQTVTAEYRMAMLTVTLQRTGTRSELIKHWEHISLIYKVIGTTCSPFLVHVLFVKNKLHCYKKKRCCFKFWTYWPLTRADTIYISGVGECEIYSWTHSGNWSTNIMQGSVRHWTRVRLVKKTSLHFKSLKGIDERRKQVTTWHDLRELLRSPAPVAAGTIG
jgi:hypothetical protein